MSAACRVFSSRVATVMGPTPPGTGVIQLARSAGFTGQIAAASHSRSDSEALFGAGVDLVLEPFQDAADRTVELLSGAVTEDRTDFLEIAAEGRTPG